MEYKFDISVVIVNYNVTNDVINCIKSIYKFSSGLRIEIIVSDNHSPDRSIENIQDIFPDIKLVLLNDNRGFGYANNAALEYINGKYILFSNPDIIYKENSIKKLFDFMESNINAACAGPVIKRTDGSIQYYYTFFPSLYSRFLQEFGRYEKADFMKKRMVNFLNDNIKLNKPFNVEWVLGACMLIPAVLFKKLSGFDDSFFLYEEEVDLLFRAKQLKYNTYIVPESEVIHNHNTSTSKVGFAFIRYHGFRSLVIYSNKHNRGIQKLLSKLMLTLGIFFRYSRGLLFNKYRIKSVKVHTLLFWDLLKINWLNIKKSDRLHRHFELLNTK